jgi:hypothetical protein
VIVFGTALGYKLARAHLDAHLLHSTVHDSDTHQPRLLFKTRNSYLLGTLLWVSRAMALLLQRPYPVDISYRKDNASVMPQMLKAYLLQVRNSLVHPQRPYSDVQG